MATIEERVTGAGVTYRVSWDLPRRMVPAGQTRAKGSLTVDRKEDAKLAQRLAHEAGHAISGPEVALKIERQFQEGMTLKEWSVEYMIFKRRGKNRERSLDGDQGMFDGVILPSLGDRVLAALTADDFTDFFRQIKTDREISYRRVDRYYALLRNMFNIAIKKQKATWNPVLASDWILNRAEPIDEEDSHPERYFTLDQYEQLLSFMRPDYRMFVRFLCETGVRFSEATALRVRDLDFDHSKASIRKASQKSHSGAVVDDDFPKSNKKRFVEVRSGFMEDLKEHVVNLTSDDLVFRASRGGAIGNSNFRRDHWNPAMVQAQQCSKHLPERQDGRSGLQVYDPTRPSECLCLGELKWTSYAPHSLRHTYASWVIAAGGSLTLLAQQLGHSSTAVTEGTYVHQIALSKKHSLSGVLDEMLRR